MWGRLEHVTRALHHRSYDAKRASIVDTASGLFAAHGYRGTSTALICRTAGISSGTFFHYFPTKLDALVAVLDAGCEALGAHLAEIDGRTSGLEAITAYADALASEIEDRSYAGFVAGIAEVESEPRVAEALRAEAGLVSEFLARQVEAGQHAGRIRQDRSASELARWAAWLLDGAAGAAAQAAAGSAATEPAPSRKALTTGLLALLEAR